MSIGEMGFEGVFLGMAPPIVGSLGSLMNLGCLGSGAFFPRNIGEGNKRGEVQHEVSRKKWQKSSENTRKKWQIFLENTWKKWQNMLA